MCRPVSMTLTKDRVFIGYGHDNHSRIIEENDLNEEGVRGVNVLNVELEPPYEDDKPLFDASLEEWTFRIDQDKLPKWHDPERDEKRARAKLPEWKCVNVGKNTGLYNSGNWNSGHRNSGTKNSGCRNSGDRNSGHGNSGTRNSGNWNSGHRNSGDFNSADYCSGFFCSEKPKLRLFNKPVDMTPSELKTLPGYKAARRLKLTQWVPISEMSDEEKEEHPEATTQKGYLKTYTYKEAWANLWNILSDKDKQAVKDLPNFDPDIFEEITGIHVEE